MNVQTDAHGIIHIQRIDVLEWNAALNAKINAHNRLSELHASYVVCTLKKTRPKIVVYQAIEKMLFSKAIEKCLHTLKMHTP